MMMGKGANSHKYGNKASVGPTFQRTNKVGEKILFFLVFLFFKFIFNFFKIYFHF